jgi:hypothetical protein
MVIGVKTDRLRSLGWERFKITATSSSSECIGEWLIAAKTSGDYWVNFVCFEIPAAADTGLFLRNGNTGSHDLVDEPSEAEVFMEGFVKWDGDAQWDVPNGLCFCGHNGARKVGKLIEEIVTLAESMMAGASFDS